MWLRRAVFDRRIKRCFRPSLTAALIYTGCAEGVKSFEADELAQAHKTFAELETELEAVKASSALFNGEKPVSPKGDARLPRASTWGYSERLSCQVAGSRARATTNTSTVYRATARSVGSFLTDRAADVHAR